MRRRVLGVRGCLALLLLPVGSRPAWPQATRGARTYVNPRFGFQITHPAEFVQDAPAAPEAPGAKFSTADGAAWFLAYARRHAGGQGLIASRREEEALFAEPDMQVTYRRGGESWFVLSGFRSRPTPGDERIFYCRVILSEGGAMTTVLRMEYPAAQRSRFDTAVTLLSRSLRPGPAGYRPTG